MKIWAQKDDVYCAELEIPDGRLFIDGMRLCTQDAEDNPEHNPRDKDTEPPFTDETMIRGLLTVEFLRWSDVHFSLLRERKGQQDEIIGKTSIFFESRNAEKTPREHPELGESYILTAERGKNLSRLLYQARLAFLEKERNAVRAQMTIRADNKASVGAARQAGFQGSENAGKIFFTRQIDRSF